MSRLLDFTPSEEDAVVSRVLIGVHKSIDHNFPEASPAPDRYAKTSFDDNEPTITNIETLEKDKHAEAEINPTANAQEQDNLVKKLIIFISAIIFLIISIYLLASSI